MSPVRKALDMLPIGFPRVSGDEPSDGRRGHRNILFSPRERG